ncbi:MAG TPA: DUF402 domain-containing protein [Pyrinomonadaceae bacterium]|nr:DUF402 domain-containing protein [Pyrinomonadaceae bacterium]
MQAETTGSSHAAESRTGQEIVVHARKFDGRLHREWEARLLSQSGSLVLVEGAFAEEIRHPLLGTIAPGTISTEYYWTDRWYSVFRFREPTGALRNYYCNINRPPEFDGRLLTFVDLDIDVLVAPDFSYRVLDEEEFESNAKRYNYPPDVRERARLALSELVGVIERREFPFDQTV